MAAAKDNVEEIGPLQRRAKKVVGNGSLYDLVETMAGKVDNFEIRLTSIEAKLDTVLEVLRGKVSD